MDEQNRNKLNDQLCKESLCMYRFSREWRPGGAPTNDQLFAYNQLLMLWFGEDRQKKAYNDPGYNMSRTHVKKLAKNPIKINYNVKNHKKSIKYDYFGLNLIQ